MYILRNMRTRSLAAALSLSLLGCVGTVDTGTPTNTQMPPGGNTGNPVNTGTGGSDPNPTGQGPGSDNGGPKADPKLNVSLDRTAVATELGKKEIVTVTVTSVDGFTGEVDVAPSVLDAAGAAIPGITVEGDATVTLAAGATKTTMYTISVPTNATGTALSGTVKFDVMSAAGAKELSTTLSVAPVLTVDYAAGLAANTKAHPFAGQTISVKKGATIKLHNADSAVHITHGQTFPHETTGATGGLAGNTYQVTTANIDAGKTGVLGCHSHGNATYGTIKIE